MAPGKQTRVESVSAVQRQHAAELRSAVQAKAADEPARVQQAAAEGIAGPSSTLPYLGRIQASFGPGVDVSGVQAHVGAEASAASDKMGARAFATGNHVAFKGTPDLHTVAHETAHVVQQRGGVQLKGGVGAAGDVHEQHADAVADRVVAGGSAAELLAPYAGGNAVGQGVQRIVEPGAKLGVSVFVTLGNGEFAQGEIIEEVVGHGYRVTIDDGGQQVFPYAQLNLHDPRATDASLGGEKWREYVRGKDQGKGRTAYDNDGTDFGRRLPQGKSYGTSMIAAQGKVSQSLGAPMSPDYVQDLHDTGSAHLSSPPDWRDNKFSGDGEIGVTLLAEHADPKGIESMRKSRTMSYHGYSGGMHYTHDGEIVDRGPIMHRIETKPMSSLAVKQELQAITTTYYETIETAQSAEQILDAIARFTQDLARLHPFRDANTRTNMLLLNKLLAENGFPLAIVEDPKHFYLNELSAWREKIVAGMKKWQKVGGKVGDASAKPTPSQASSSKASSSKASSSKARGKQAEPRRAPVSHDDLDIEVRPLEELFEDDPEGLDELRTGMQEIEIARNTAVIQQRQRAIEALQTEVAELNRLFGTYASLVAQASDGVDAIGSQVEHGNANVDEANRRLQ